MTDDLTGSDRSGQVRARQLFGRPYVSAFQPVMLMSST